jgi:hypothetical protein
VADLSLDSFMQGLSKPVDPPILKTPIRKPKPSKQAEKIVTRRSGRLAEKAMKNGRRPLKNLCRKSFARSLMAREKSRTKS